MKTMKLIFFFLCLSITTFSQVELDFTTEPVVANFNKAMALTKASDIELDSLFLLTNTYGLGSSDSSLILARKVEELLKGNTNQRLLSIGQVRLGEAYRMTGDEAGDLTYRINV